MKIEKLKSNNAGSLEIYAEDYRNLYFGIFVFSNTISLKVSDLVNSSRRLTCISAHYILIETNSHVFVQILINSSLPIKSLASLFFFSVSNLYYMSPSVSSLYASWACLNSSWSNPHADMHVDLKSFMNLGVISGKLYSREFR